MTGIIGYALLGGVELPLRTWMVDNNSTLIVSQYADYADLR